MIVIKTDLSPVNPASFNTAVLSSVKVILTDATVRDAGAAVAKANRDAETAAKNKQVVDQSREYCVVLTESTRRSSPRRPS
jgi:hypothetical protein